MQNYRSCDLYFNSYTYNGCSFKHVISCSKVHYILVYWAGMRFWLYTVNKTLSVCFRAFSLKQDSTFMTKCCSICNKNGQQGYTFCTTIAHGCHSCDGRLRCTAEVGQLCITFAFQHSLALIIWTWWKFEMQ